MEASPKKIIEYFNGERQSIIPLFQRPYTWVPNNWRTLWGDIMAFYDDPSPSSGHFMSTIVSFPQPTTPVGVSKHLIIDGQQRLTTISLLLCALRDVEKRRADQIQDYLVNRHHKGLDYLKLLPTEGDREEYLKVIKRENSSSGAHAMRNCYKFFEKKLSEKQDDGSLIDPERIFDITKQHLQVVMIHLHETDDPYQIFESLNSKGEKLTQADLVRNYVLMKFRHSSTHGSTQKSIYDQLWWPMERLLERNINEFLWHYTIMQGYNVKKPKTYTAIREHFNRSSSEEEHEASLAKMSDSAKTYAKLMDSSKELNPAIKKELLSLNESTATITYPLLLRVFASFESGMLDEKVVIKSLQIINSFILRRAVCDEKRSALNKLFIRLTSNFPDKPEIDEWLVLELSKGLRSERWPDDIEFRNAIINNKVYGKKEAKILLESIETCMANKEIINLTTGKITIEHIMPQTLTDEWKKELGDDHENVYRTYLDTIGNLTLTGYNSELSNSSFFRKEKVLPGKWNCPEQRIIYIRILGRE